MRSSKLVDFASDSPGVQITLMKYDVWAVDELPASEIDECACSAFGSGAFVDQDLPQANRSSSAGLLSADVRNVGDSR